jgi:hypothetical protein
MGARLGELLAAGAAEIRSRPDAARWESLSARMESASRLSDEMELRSEIEAIGRAILDGAPLEEGFAPSFGRALEAVQRRDAR